MDMPAGIAAVLDGRAAFVGSRATTARGVLDQHGHSDASAGVLRAIKSGPDPDGPMNPGKSCHPASDHHA